MDPVQTDARTVEEYLARLPVDRRSIMAAVREVIRQNLPEGYEECMQYGMISYVIPFSRYPETYNGQPLGYVALASQKNYISLYLMGIYASPENEAWFREEYQKSGKRLDMGKSCLRFKRLEDLPLDLVGKAIGLLSVEAFIQRYEQSRQPRGAARQRES